MFPRRSTLAGVFVIGVVSACSKNYPPVASLVLGDCEGRTYEPALVHVESKLLASGLNGTVNESGKDHPRPAVLMRTYSIGEPRPDASSNNVVAVVTVTERTARVDILAAMRRPGNPGAHSTRAGPGVARAPQRPTRRCRRGGQAVRLGSVPRQAVDRSLWRPPSPPGYRPSRCAPSRSPRQRHCWNWHLVAARRSSKCA